MLKSKKHRNAIEQFIAHMGRYVDIQPYHKQWVERTATYTVYKRGDCVYDSESDEEHIFYVSSGLLGRCHIEEIPNEELEANTDTVLEENLPEEYRETATDGEEAKPEKEPKLPKPRRTIISIGIPQMVLMSTEHLYSKTQATGQIMALRTSEVLTISYSQIKRFMRDDNSLDGMLYALSNKKKRQLARLRQVNAIRDPQSGYIRFIETLPELCEQLNQTEQQDLIGISRRTINRARHLYATGKPKR